jgi:hypothetical protein
VTPLSDALTAASRDNATAATHLSRLGVNPITVARLTEFAEADEITLRELVRYVLSDYRPAE